MTSLTASANLYTNEYINISKILILANRADR